MDLIRAGKIFFNCIIIKNKKDKLYIQFVFFLVGDIDLKSNQVLDFLMVIGSI